MEQVVAKGGGGRSGSNDPMLGKVVAGRYRLEARLGEGGMGVVYRARHVLIERVVALKLIRPDLRGETHLRAWMLREARAANRVDHAHIIDIHDIGETEEGELYLVMEYLVGTALSTELARGLVGGTSRSIVQALANSNRARRASLRIVRAKELW
jgi:serine/threonine-protein kinase